MSCVEIATRFRLLDGNVGWDHDARCICAPHDMDGTGESAECVCEKHGMAGVDHLAEADCVCVTHDMDGTGESAECVYATRGVAGMDDDAGLRLMAVADGRVGSDTLSPYIPPPWLARGCGPCQWYLLTPGSYEPKVSKARRCDDAAAPNTLGPLVLRRDPCSGLWTGVYSPSMSNIQLLHPVAIAVRGSRLAVANEAAGKVLIWSIPDRRLGAIIDVEAPTAVAFAPWGDVLVAISTEAAARTPAQNAPNGAPPDTQVNVARFSPTGEPRGQILFDAKGQVQRLAAGEDCAVWAAIGDPVGPFDLHRIVLDDIDQPVHQDEEYPNDGRHGSPSSMLAHQCCPPDEFKIEKITGQPLKGTLKRLAEAFPRSGLVAVSADGFCLEEPGLGVNAAHGSIAPGDTVIVAKQGAELRVRNHIVARLDRGTRLQVCEAVCDQIVVRVVDDRRKLGGSIDRTQVNRLRADDGASSRVRCFLRNGETAPRHVAAPPPAPAPRPSTGTLVLCPTYTVG